MSVVPRQGSATLKILPPIYMLFEHADVVATTTIEHTEERQIADETCAFIYAGRIERIFKANRTMRAGAPLTFGRHPGLRTGKSYLIFGRFQNDAASVLAEMKQQDPLLAQALEKAPRNDVVDAIRCRGTVPGLNLIEGAAWEVRGSYAVVRNMPPNFIPTSIRVTEDLPRGFRVDLEQLYLYLDDLKRWPPAR